MIRTVEAQIDEQGNIRLVEAIHLPSPRRALVTILDEPATIATSGSVLGGSLVPGPPKRAARAAYSYPASPHILRLLEQRKASSQSTGVPRKWIDGELIG